MKLLGILNCYLKILFAQLQYICFMFFITISSSFITSGQGFLYAEEIKYPFLEATVIPFPSVLICPPILSDKSQFGFPLLLFKHTPFVLSSGLSISQIIHIYAAVDKLKIFHCFLSSSFRLLMNLYTQDLFLVPNLISIPSSHFKSISLGKTDTGLS